QIDLWLMHSMAWVQCSSHRGTTQATHGWGLQRNCPKPQSSFGEIFDRPYNSVAVMIHLIRGGWRPCSTEWPRAMGVREVVSSMERQRVWDSGVSYPAGVFIQVRPVAAKKC